MLTSRERVRAALEFRVPDRLPLDIWGHRLTGKLHPELWREVVDRFPMDLCRPEPLLGPSVRARDSVPGLERARIDDWGSVWQTAETGVSGEVKQPAIPDLEMAADFDPPWECLEGSHLEEIQAVCEDTDLFRLGEMGPGPFERLQFLRGTENLFLDMGMARPELDALMEKVHSFNLRHVDLWCESAVDAIGMGDDWGSQTALIISPTMWRDRFKPLYAEYVRRTHAAGKSFFFHSDGFTREIIPDLIEIGVDALNCQLFCMDLEEIAASFKGKILFWGELDRQFTLRYGRERDVREAARRWLRAFYDPAGGCIGQLAWTIGDPVENITAAFEELSAAGEPKG